MYRFPNHTNNYWLSRYNNLVADAESRQSEYAAIKQSQPKRNDKASCWSNQAIGVHHIIPKTIAPELCFDSNNLLLCTLEEHCWLHYFLWRYDWQYASHFWFLLQAARKFNWWDCPGGEDEYMRMREDVAKYRQQKKQGIEWTYELTYQESMTDVKAMPANEEALNFEKNDSKYYFTKSTAYAANSTNLPIEKEPWLHVKLISVTKYAMSNGIIDKDKREVRWYAVVYVWDTRQVVQFVELPAGTDTSTKQFRKVVDNGYTLKDKEDKVPGWAKRFALGRSWPSEP